VHDMASQCASKCRNLFSMVLLISLCLVGCSGGGDSADNSSTVSSQGEQESAGQMLTYAEDVLPIMTAKCVGCHNDGDNPLAPLSLEGEERATSFISAIHFAVEGQTMPPAGGLQLTRVEREKLLAWSSNEAYAGGSEILRIALVEAIAWDTQPKNQDAFFDHRPDVIDCARDRGWFAEEGAVEIRTEFCNYASLTQQALLDLDSGTTLELRFSHSELNFNAPSSAHVAISVAGVAIWEKTFAIPDESELFKETLTLPVAVKSGDSIELHIHNHGDNTWTLHSLEALVSGDQELTFCPSYENTFDAIQATVFEQAGCANSLCHGTAEEGGLNLTPVLAHESLVGVRAFGSSLNLIEPREPSKSYLYQKLSAKIFPGSYPIGGAPMPSAGSAITPGQLKAISIWIEAGAPKEGSIGDTTGEGEGVLENLLGVCLPEPEPVNVIPLPPPDPTKGIQFAMPPHEAPAEEEKEVCFAVYEDFRDVIPPQYMTADREFFYSKGEERREDPFTHHNVLFLSSTPLDKRHDLSFGEWACVGGDNAGNTCEPVANNACGAGKCRSEIKGNIACRGYGPPPPIDTDPEPGDDALTGGGLLPLQSTIEKEGFYETFPTHGIFYWNSHAFNLTTQDALLHIWHNFYFADDRRFEAKRINGAKYIFDAIGTPAFGRKTVCRDFIFDQGDGLLLLSSHTHKRGERFFMNLDSELIYESFTYDEPVTKLFEPAIVFNSTDPAQRTLEYCATYNNGLNADDSPNINTVTRMSQRPPNAGKCKPTACVAGNIGEPCDGAQDDAACDSSPGAGDGWCDACAIGLGVTSDDEMFIIRGSRMSNYDALINAAGP
jgi:hypothetical protein